MPIECVVRGYLAGSGWAEYRRSGSVCGIKLPAGLAECEQLNEPIFTPATKEENGHDVNISFAEMAERVGRAVAEQLRSRSLEFIVAGPNMPAQRNSDCGHQIRMGPLDGELILIDEALTPDSSRFWPADQYLPGRGQPSFDKQFVRDWLSATSWDKNSPPPSLPADVVTKTRAKYVEAYERLTGRPFAWQ